MTSTNILLPRVYKESYKGYTGGLIGPDNFLAKIDNDKLFNIFITHVFNTTNSKLIDTNIAVDGKDQFHRRLNTLIIRIFLEILVKGKEYDQINKKLRESGVIGDPELDSKVNKKYNKIIFEELPDLYYNIIARLFTQSYEESLSKRSPLFKSLENAKNNLPYERQERVNNQVEDAKRFVENWNKNVTDLKLRREHQYERIQDVFEKKNQDNITIKRQAHLNKDQLERSRASSYYLRIMLGYISLIIIFLGLPLFGVSKKIGETIAGFLLIAFVINSIYLSYYARRRHLLSYNYIPYSGKIILSTIERECDKDGDLITRRNKNRNNCD